MKYSKMSVVDQESESEVSKTNWRLARSGSPKNWSFLITVCPKSRKQPLSLKCFKYIYWDPSLKVSLRVGSGWKKVLIRNTCYKIVQYEQVTLLAIFYNWYSRTINPIWDSWNATFLANAKNISNERLACETAPSHGCGAICIFPEQNSYTR